MGTRVYLDFRVAKVIKVTPAWMDYLDSRGWLEVTVLREVLAYRGDLAFLGGVVARECQETKAFQVSNRADVYDILVLLNWPIDWLADGLTDWLNLWLTESLTDWVAEGFVD